MFRDTYISIFTDFMLLWPQGELFENAIEKGYLSAVQTQHPGFYFHSAANHCIQRRVNAKDFRLKQFPLASQWTTENPSPVDALNSLEFYGQRPWRQGQGMEILDQQKETQGILCLQEIESKENLIVFDCFIFPS